MAHDYLIDMSDLDETAEYLTKCHPHNVIPALVQLSKYFNTCYTKKEVVDKLYNVFTARLQRSNNQDEIYYWSRQLEVILKNMKFK